jgi:hypothetical protein
MQQTGELVRYRQSEQAQSSTVGDRVVLYHRETQKALVLNPSGSRLWKELSSPRTEAELAAELCRAYPGLSASTAAQDVSRYLEQLTEHSLLVAEG